MVVGRCDEVNSLMIKIDVLDSATPGESAFLLDASESCHLIAHLLGDLVMRRDREAVAASTIPTEDTTVDEPHGRPSRKRRRTIAS